VSGASATKIIAVALALAIGVVLTYGVFRIVGQERKQSCIAEAQARYPAVAVSNPNPFGADQIVSNVNRRIAALDNCEATIF
jgi:hypothetical protein